MRKLFLGFLLLTGSLICAGWTSSDIQGWGGNPVATQPVFRTGNPATPDITKVSGAAVQLTALADQKAIATQIVSPTPSPTPTANATATITPTMISVRPVNQDWPSYTTMWQKQPAATTATDFWVLNASATRNIFLKKVYYTGSAAAGNEVQPVLTMRSALDTGGTPVTLTKGPFVTSNPASTSANSIFYTANPTQNGSLLANWFSAEYFNNNVGSTGSGVVIWDFSDWFQMPMLAAGSTECFTLSFGGLNAASQYLSGGAEWIER